MVYKKYIKRGGKVFGPYYYESYRDKNGKVRTRYVDGPGSGKVKKKNTDFLKLAVLIFGLVLFLALAGLVFKIQGYTVVSLDAESFEGDVVDFRAGYDRDFESYALTGNGSLLYFNYSEGNFIRLKLKPQNGWYLVECFNNGYEQIALVREASDENYSIPDSCDGKLQIRISYFSESGEDLGIEESNNIGVQNETEIVNETTESIQNETEIVNEMKSEDNVSETEKVEEEPDFIMTGENVLEIDGEFYEIVIYKIEGTDDLMQAENVSTRQYKAVIGRPVKWIKNTRVSSVDENITIAIPKLADNISVLTGGEVAEALSDVGEYEMIIRGVNRKDLKSGAITGNVGFDIKKDKGFFTRLWGWLVGLTITGNVISEIELQDEILETINEKIVNVSNIFAETGDEEIAVEYYTPAPEAVEEEISNGKRVVITGPDEVHYENVLAYSELDNSVSMNESEKIRLFWYDGGKRLRQDFDYYDLDEDGNIDYIEWIVPSLSEQIYEIIYITKAEHLDSDRNFIEDVYDFVKEKDDNWTLINDGHYLRVTFEQELDNTKDITIYARGGNSEIEVYVENGNESIAKFENILNEDWYKIYLTNLTENYWVFDLKILGDVEVDYVVDPAPVEYGAPTDEVYTCGNITASGIYTMNQSLVDAEVIPASSSGCIDIQAENVLFDCAGFNITNTSMETGIYSNSSNTTIINCIITSGGTSFTHGGIILQNSDNSNVTNNTINSYQGIRFSSSDNGVIQWNNVSFATLFGIEISTSTNNTLLNNTLYYNSYGIDLTESSDNVIANNTANHNVNYGISLDLGANNNQILSNNLYNCTTSVFGCLAVLVNSNNNSILGGIINKSTAGLIYISDNAANNIVKNVVLANGVYGVYIPTSGSNTSLLNISFINNSADIETLSSSLGEVNFTNISLKLTGTYGNISWDNDVTVYSTNLSNDVIIQSNSIYVNSSVSGLNASARLTFYDTNALGYTNRWPLRDGINCSASICTEIQDADTYIFDVGHFTTYSVGGTASAAAGTTGEGTIFIPCNGADANRDGRINILDLIYIRNRFGILCFAESNWCDCADVNQDGVVDMNDLDDTRDNLGKNVSQQNIIISGGESADFISEPEVPVVGKVGGSNYECFEWGECKFSYRFEDLVRGVDRVGGRQERVCKDEGNIGFDLIQSKKCFVELEIYAEEKDWCDKSYLWIYDKETNNLLGRIMNQKNATIPFVNIEFLNNAPEYCDYCYDGAQDRDETGVDCGGSCRECVAYSPYSASLLDRVMGWLGF